MNKLFFITSFLLIFVGCTKSYEKITFLEQGLSSVDYNRLPSNSLESECFIDNFSIDIIKSENKVLEQKWSSKVAVPSKFKFTSFKAAETHYIKKYSEYIFLNDESRSCKDLPCVLNISYGDANSEAGHRIYNWFLTMGSGISTLDDIPGYARDSGSWKTKVIKDFLFPVEELKLLNITAKILSPRYKDILVSTIHRFPNGSSPGTNVAGQYNGFRGASVKPHREIFLTEQSFYLDPKAKKINGYYLHTLIHELSHALDFTYGKEGTFDNYSDGSKWLDLSWKFAEGTDITTKVVNGVKVEVSTTTIKWRPDETNEDGFIRAYQRTSPAEDFADSGAYYIVDAKQLDETSPNKFSIYKDIFYLKESFKESDIQLVSEDKAVFNLKEKIWDITKECALDSNKDYNDSDIILPASLSYLDNKTKKCLKFQLEIQVDLALKKIKNENYLGCYYLKSAKQSKVNSIVNKIENDLVASFDSLNKYKEIKVKWAAFRGDLSHNCDPVNIFIQNREYADAKTQFSEELKQCAEKVYMETGIFEEIFNEEKESYISKYNYEMAKNDALIKFKNFTKGLSTEFSDIVRNNIQSCRDTNLKNASTLVLNPVNGGSVYIEGVVLNCINNNFDKNYDFAISSFLENKEEITLPSRDYIRDIYRNEFINTYNTEFASISSEENSKYLSPILNNINLSFKDLSSRTSFLADYYNLDEDEFNKKLEIEIKQTLLDIWEPLGRPITISSAEVIGLVFEVVKEQSILNAKALYSKKVDSVKPEMDAIYKSISNKMEMSELWSDKSIKGSFTERCKTIFQEKNSLFTSNLRLVQSDFLNQSSLEKEFVDLSCAKIEVLYKKEIIQINETVLNKYKTIENDLLNDKRWMMVKNSNELKKSCNMEIKKKVLDSKQDTRFINNDDYILLYEDQIFPSVLNHWKQFELKSLIQLLSCDNNCESIKSDLFAQSYLEKIIKPSLDKRNEFIANETKKCNEKYPNIRFAVYKIKRNKCIEEIKTNASELIDNSLEESLKIPLIKYIERN